MEFLIRVDTNLKLNIHYQNGESLIPESERDDEEIHYIKFESVISSYEIRITTLFKLLREMVMRPSLTFGEWVITDFDNYLKGNPLI